MQYYPRGVSVAFKRLAKGERYDNALVVDNSVMMRWLFKDGSSSDQDYAHSVLEKIKAKNLRVIAPYIWVYEAAFVSHYYTKQQAIRYDEAITCLDALFELSTIIRGEETPSQLLEIADAYSVSSYAAAYLLLAKQHDCPLATLDKKMQKACKKAKGKLFETRE